MQWMSERSLDPLLVRTARVATEEPPRKPPLVLVTVLFAAALASQILAWPDHDWWRPFVIAALVIGYVGVLWDRWKTYRTRRDDRALLAE